MYVYSDNKSSSQHSLVHYATLSPKSLVVMNADEEINLKVITYTNLSIW